VEGLPCGLGERLGKRAPSHDDEGEADGREEPEDRSPSQADEEPPADDRRDGGRQSEEERHERHQPLRVLGPEEVADHRAPDDHARADRKALDDAPQDERVHRDRKRGADRGERVHHERHEDYRPSPEAVGEGTVEQEHQAEREQVARHRLLDFERARLQRLLDAGERGQVRVDREGPERRERGEERGEAPAEAAGGDVLARDLHQRAAGSASSARRMSSSALPQSKARGWRNRRALAYQGESGRSSIQR
jgi:hypothetical protein